MSANPIIEKYLDSVRSNIYDLVESERFISTLRQSIYDFADGREDLTLEDLIAEFGTPDEIANEYLSDVPELQLENVEKADRKKKMIIGIIAIGILIAIGIYIWVTHAPTDVSEIELPIQQS